MGNIHIHLGYHTGANNRYLYDVLNLLDKDDSYDVKVTKEKLPMFLENNPPKADVLLYQTYPDEFNKGKFNQSMIEASDKIFRDFKGLKILVCSHDNGDIDSFSRFSDSKKLPRIKTFPSKRFMNEYNVVLITTFSTPTGNQTYHDKYERDIKVSCKFRTMKHHHKIREYVIESLRDSFADVIDFTLVKDKVRYREELQRTLIVVGAPGWGPHNGTYVEALKAGCLLFAHRTLNDYCFLPHQDLIDGEDFVSYDLYNIKNKLQRLLENPQKIERIRKSGRYAIKWGFDYRLTADKFYSYLNGELR